MGISLVAPAPCQAILPGNRHRERGTCEPKTLSDELPRHGGCSSQAVQQRHGSARSAYLSGPRAYRRCRHDQCYCTASWCESVHRACGPAPGMWLDTGTEPSGASRWCPTREIAAGGRRTSRTRQGSRDLAAARMAELAARSSGVTGQRVLGTEARTYDPSLQRLAGYHGGTWQTGVHWVPSPDAGTSESRRTGLAQLEESTHRA